MKRITATVTLDADALKTARRLTGKKSYSETINHAIEQIGKRDRLKKAIQELANDPNPWWPGYVEEYGPNPPLPVKDRKRVRRAAQEVRAPGGAKHRGSR